MTDFDPDEFVDEGRESGVGFAFKGDGNEVFEARSACMLGEEEREGAIAGDEAERMRGRNGVHDKASCLGTPELIKRQREREVNPAGVERGRKTKATGRKTNERQIGRELDLKVLMKAVLSAGWEGCVAVFVIQHGRSSAI